MTESYRRLFAGAADASRDNAYSVVERMRAHKSKTTTQRCDPRLLVLGSPLTVGVDLAESEDAIIPAPDDAEGVAAAFNKKLLTRLTREFDAVLVFDDFRHLAVWCTGTDRQIRRMDSGVPRLRDTPKFRQHSLDGLRTTEEVGWQTCQAWTSDNTAFAIFELKGLGAAAV
jgi:Histidine-specific methyltransferase, SAM-dependent